jgi:hypothetical protein
LLVQVSGTQITWLAAIGAVSYHLTGEVTATEVSRQGYCVAPQLTDLRRITLDEMVPGTRTSFDLPLPAIPPGDFWSVSADFLEIVGFDAQGRVVGASRSIHVVEGCQVEATPAVERPGVQLPSTGGGNAGAPGGVGHDGWAVAIGLIGLIVIAAGGRLRLGWQRRA